MGKRYRTPSRKFRCRYLRRLKNLAKKTNDLVFQYYLRYHKQKELTSSEVYETISPFIFAEFENSIPSDIQHLFKDADFNLRKTIELCEACQENSKKIELVMKESKKRLWVNSWVNEHNQMIILGLNVSFPADLDYGKVSETFISFNGKIKEGGKYRCISQRKVSNIQTVLGTIMT